MGIESWTCARLPSVCPPSRKLLRDFRLTASRVRMCELAVEHSPSIMVDPYEAISVRPPPRSLRAGAPSNMKLRSPTTSPPPRSSTTSRPRSTARSPKAACCPLTARRA